MPPQLSADGDLRRCLLVSDPTAHRAHEGFLPNPARSCLSLPQLLTLHHALSGAFLLGHCHWPQLFWPLGMPWSTVLGAPCTSCWEAKFRGYKYLLPHAGRHTGGAGVFGRRRIGQLDAHLCPMPETATWTLGPWLLPCSHVSTLTGDFWPSSLCSRGGPGFKGLRALSRLSRQTAPPHPAGQEVWGLHC